MLGGNCILILIGDLLNLTEMIKCCAEFVARESSVNFSWQGMGLSLYGRNQRKWISFCK